MFTSVKQNTIYPWHYVFEIFKKRLNNYMGLPTKPSDNCKRKVIYICLYQFEPLILEIIHLTDRLTTNRIKLQL